MSNQSESKAVLRSSTPPSEENRRRLLAFLEKKYGAPVTMEWERDDKLVDGSLLQVGSEIYDWSV